MTPFNRLTYHVSLLFSSYVLSGLCCLVPRVQADDSNGFRQDIRRDHAQRMDACGRFGAGLCAAKRRSRLPR